MSTTTYHRLAQSLLVKDICSQVICGVEKHELAGDLVDYFQYETLVPKNERWEDGSGTLVVVEDESGIPCGWYDLEELSDFYKYCCDETEVKPHSSDPIGSLVLSLGGHLEGSMPLLDAIRSMQGDEAQGRLVWEGEKLVGLLQPSDLYKMEGRLCLFSLILAIETSMLDFMQILPNTFHSILGPAVTNNLERLYRQNNNNREPLNKGATFPYSGLREKIKAMNEFGVLKKYVLDWGDPSDRVNSPRTHKLIQLRNCIAHDHPEWDMRHILPTGEVYEFVRWMLDVHHHLNFSMGVWSEHPAYRPDDPDHPDNELAGSPIPPRRRLISAE